MITMKMDMGRSSGWEGRQQAQSLKTYVGGKTQDWFFPAFLASLQTPQSLHPLGGWCYELNAALISF